MNFIAATLERQDLSCGKFSGSRKDIQRFESPQMKNVLYIVYTGFFYLVKKNERENKTNKTKTHI